MDVYDEYATFVTDYLNEKERYVGYLASLCAGLESAVYGYFRYIIC